MRILRERRSTRVSWLTHARDEDPILTPIDLEVLEYNVNHVLLLHILILTDRLALTVLLYSHLWLCSISPR